jgi:hypothetical protein
VVEDHRTGDGGNARFGRAGTSFPPFGGVAKAARDSRCRPFGAGVGQDQDRPTFVKTDCSTREVAWTRADRA